MSEGNHIQQPDPRDRELASLRQRLSRLSEAGRRINESLDFDQALQAVVDGARALTGARHAVITVTGPAGQTTDFIVSGITPEEHRALWELPAGPVFYEYLGRLGEPLRVADIGSHLSALGMPEFRPPMPLRSLLVAPIRNRGAGVGAIYVANQEPEGEFGAWDEELLVLFAAQAALVIANARQHRGEQQARANLETLLETSPVGVVVFDAREGRVAFLNREARRMAGGLLAPGDPVERPLETLAFRRADGREVSLAEFSLAQALSTGETVRAEEITLELPDGRSLTTLVNATPIRGEDGEVASFVVTLQDLSPLEDLERLRADFLGMVSHELRTPLTSINGAAATLLGQGAALDPAETRQFHRVIAEQAELMRRLLSDLLDATRLWTGALPVSPEPSEPSALVDEARSAFLASGGGHGITLDLEPGLPWVLADRRRVLQTLGNLLANAARHSSATSPIVLSAAQEEGWVHFSVADRGRGIAPKRLPHLFRRFSSLDGGNAGGGDGGAREGMAPGLGLFICRGIVEAHGGRIRAESEGLGLGSRFTFTLPVAQGMAAALTGQGNGPEQDTDEATGVLVVDDDPATLRHVRDVLAAAGYAPLVAADPEEALRLFAAERPRLALLDLLLPGSDGIELMGRLRRIAETPVIFLSAHGREETISLAFESGAVDYVVKPFSSAELVARVRNALRPRASPPPPEPSEPFTLGELNIDYRMRRVSLAGERLTLSPIEYDLLFVLSVNAGRPLTFDQLLSWVWGPQHKRDKRIVRAYVKRLRSKLGEDATQPRYILAEPRVGYRMGEPDPAGPVSGDGGQSRLDAYLGT